MSLKHFGYCRSTAARKATLVMFKMAAAIREEFPCRFTERSLRAKKWSQLRVSFVQVVKVNVQARPHAVHWPMANTDGKLYLSKL